MYNTANHATFPPFPGEKIQQITNVIITQLIELERTHELSMHLKYIL